MKKMLILLLVLGAISTSFGATWASKVRPGQDQGTFYSDWWWGDNSYLYFGDGKDFSIVHDGTTTEFTGDFVVKGTTPTITIGDGGAEDAQINFDGNAQDFAIGIDDSADSLLIKNGTALTPFTAAISINSSQVVAFRQPVVFSGGQTRKVLFSAYDVTVDDTAGPARAVLGTSAQSQQTVLQFDADGGSTGDDHAYINWLVPDGYETNSARLNVCYTFSTAEDEADEAQFDFTVNAVAAGEAVDAAGTALADQTTVIGDASADNGNLHIDTYNIEVEDIAVGDLVVIKVTVDESESDLANSGTLDVLYFEIEYESTE